MVSLGLSHVPSSLPFERIATFERRRFRSFSVLFLFREETKGGTAPLLRLSKQKDQKCIRSTGVQREGRKEHLVSIFLQSLLLFKMEINNSKI